MLDLWNQIIYDLNGSCNTLASVLDGHNALELEDDTEFLAYLDGEIFCCAACGWWYEVSEMSDIETDTVCVGCEEDY